MGGRRAAEFHSLQVSLDKDLRPMAAGIQHQESARTLPSSCWSKWSARW